MRAGALAPHPLLHLIFAFSLFFSLVTAHFEHVPPVRVRPRNHHRDLVRARQRVGSLRARDTLPSGWTAQGCWLDNVGGRTLSADSYVDSTGMTQESCANFCNNNGFAYAGVEYSQECYCDNHIENGGALTDDSGCNMACSGNANEICGGPNRLTLFYSNVPPPPPPPPPVEVPSFGNWTSLGCYTEGNGGRTLATQAPLDASNVTIENCVAACLTLGFRLAGAEFSSQCFCGSEFDLGGAPATDDGCTMTCSGNSSEFCGGPNRLSAYNFTGTIVEPSQPEVNPGFGNWTSIGCYSEGNGGRALANGEPVPGGATNMTVDNCLNTCFSLGFPLAGLEFADECYCGTSFEFGGAPADDGGCTMTCAGNSSELCGGPNRLNAYNYTGVIPNPAQPPAGGGGDGGDGGGTTAVENPGFGNWTDLGCYSEGDGGRTLGVGIPVPGGATNMTVANCLNSCVALGYPLAGVEFADECYCGLAFEFGGAPATDGCTMPCAGNATELCGGPNRLNAYNYTGVIDITPTQPGGGGGAPPAGGPLPVSVDTGLPDGWAYIGCYTEGVNARALSTGFDDNNNLTVAICVDECAASNFTIAGMEYSVQCYCGNIMQDAPTKAPETDCDMGCGGNTTQACGAGNRLSVYAATPTIEILPVPTVKTTDLVDGWTYQGCYIEPDFPANRIFPYKIVDAANQTIDNCLTLCQTYGYPGAGVEYGQECWCGDISDTSVSPGIDADSACNFPCPGAPTEYCGAGNRLSMYFYNGTALFDWHQPEVIGRYEFLVGGPVVPLITALGLNNKVTFLEKLGSGPPNSTHAYELDYTLASNALLSWREMHVQTDVFCSGGVILPDKAGRQLNVGGWSLDSTWGVRLYWPDGTLGTNGTNDWQENYDELKLQIGRWYPGSMVLSNGSVLVMGGERGANDIPEPTLEILPQIPGGNTTVFLQFLQDTDPFNLYPFLFVLPGGGIYCLVYNQARILDQVTFETLKLFPTIPGAVDSIAGRTYPMQGATVMLPMHAPYTDPVVMLTCGGSPGGGAQTLDNCVLITPEVDGSDWVIERMPFRRVMPCFAALPDGTFLIVNGAGIGIAGFGLADDPTLTALLYDPTLPIGSRISILNTTIVARMYHSEAILMHDGRVLISGSDPLTTVLFPNGTVNPDLSFPEEYRVEVYYPPYLVTGNQQPTYTITNTDWTYGQKYSIVVNLFQGTTATMKISLLGAVVSTHGNNFGQRTLFPAFSCKSNVCVITAPPDNKICPPGWFQLFVLDGPTPSFSQWVRIGGDPAQLGNWPDFPDFTLPGL